jgi:hypothetical protein
MHTIKPRKRRVLGELKRSRRLTMNLTAQEFERLEIKAEEAGVAMAVYVRREEEVLITHLITAAFLVAMFLLLRIH